MKVNENIKKLRLAIGFQLGEFGKIFSVTTSTVCNWESGRRSPRLPNIRKMVELAKKHRIKLTIDDFLT